VGLTYSQTSSDAETSRVGSLTVPLKQP